MFLALSTFFLTDTSQGDWCGYVYPTMRRDGSSAGPQNNKVVLACHMCCFR